MPRKTKLETNIEKYDELRDVILKILKINNNNRSFSLFEIDNDTEIQKNILELEKECEKYFAVKSWTYFRNKNRGKIDARSYLTFLRNLFHFLNIQYYNKQTSMMVNGHVVYYMKYTII